MLDLEDVAVVEGALEEEEEAGGGGGRKEEEAMKHLRHQTSQKRLGPPPRVPLRSLIPPLTAAVQLLQAPEGPVVVQGDADVRRLDFVLAAELGQL